MKPFLTRVWRPLEEGAILEKPILGIFFSFETLPLRLLLE